ncbi:MAG: ABC transporter permease [Bacteroidota bacterium]
MVSLVAFGLSQCSPGDPVDRLLINSENDINWENKKQYERDYRYKARDLGVDRPPFYLSLLPRAYPDTLQQIVPPDRRRSMRKLLDQYGNWDAVHQYMETYDGFMAHFSQLPDSLGKDDLINLQRHFLRLEHIYKDAAIQYEWEEIGKDLEKNPELEQQIATELSELKAAYANLQSTARPSDLMIPSIRVNGLDNQYHNWLVAFLQGDFGVSLQNGQPAGQKIKDALWWTVVLSLLSMFFTFLIAIPLGVYSANRYGQWFDRITSAGLFMLYSLPTFWIATMLVMFFTTSQFGDWANIFPSVGLGNMTASDPFWPRFWQRLTHLILPVFCLTYGGLAFMARQMRGSTLDVKRQDFIRTAWAKGLSPHQVHWRHNFRNAVFPLITMMAGILPAAITGSVVIELIFNIPGMGLLVLDSILAKDWPVVYIILMLTAVMTILGNLMADILYTWADPRVKFDL